MSVLWKFSLTHSYKAMWLYISSTSLPSMERSQVRMGTTNLPYIITVKSEKNWGEYSNIFKLHCFIMTNSKLRVRALFGSVPLLCSHKITKFGPPSPIVCTCSILVTAPANVQNSASSPLPPPTLTITTTTHPLSKQ